MGQPKVEASSGSIAVRKDDGNPPLPHPNFAENSPIPT